MTERRVHSPLLPPNQTRLEASLANASHLPLTPEVLATLWNANTCPVQLLPWLAWSLSVDEWDDTWPEARKRQAVRQAVQLHRKKGTPWAIRRALEVHGYPGCEIIEYTEYQQRWADAGGLYMDGSWHMDGRYMAPHLAQGGAVMRGAVLNHWAQYAIRVNAAEEVWSRQAQRTMASVARRYAPARCHLVALVGLLRWGFAMPSGMRLGTQRVRVTFKGCGRITSQRLPTLDGCWTMDGQSHAPTMDGAWRMDGARPMHTTYTGQAMQGGHIRMRQRLRVHLHLHACGQRTAVHDMSPQPIAMDGRLRMDRNTLSGTADMAAGISMGAAQMDRLGLRRLDGAHTMGRIGTSRCIAMHGTATLRSGGQITTENL